MRIPSYAIRLARFVDRIDPDLEGPEPMSARVLVVDDNAPNRRLLAARLNAEYFDVLTASNGPEAIGICEKTQCDIVLLDVMMPDMDGFEVCRRLRSLDVTAHLPIVMVTALDQPSDLVRGLEAGADDFLTKPIDEVHLIARVRSLARLKVVIDEMCDRARHERSAWPDRHIRGRRRRKRPSGPLAPGGRPREFFAAACPGAGASP